MGEFLLVFPKNIMGVSKNRGTPKSSILIGFSIIKPSILGYPYSWKHPSAESGSSGFIFFNYPNLGGIKLDANFMLSLKGGW